MKVTKREVESVVRGALGDIELKYEIHIGRDRKGNKIVGVEMNPYNPEFPSIFVPLVMDLAEKYDEKYIPVALGSMWPGYVIVNGFTEDKEEEPFPISIQWNREDVSILYSDGSASTVSDEALETFCRTTLTVIVKRELN